MHTPPRYRHLLVILLLLPALAKAGPPDPMDLLGFVENRGQAPQEVFAYTPTRAGVSLVTRDGRLIHRVATENGKTTRIEERFADEPLRPRSLAQAPTRVSFFTGATPKGWRNDIPTHEVIGLGEAAPGVRVQLLARPGNVENASTWPRAPTPMPSPSICKGPVILRWRKTAGCGWKPPGAPCTSPPRWPGSPAPTVARIPWKWPTWRTAIATDSASVPMTPSGG